MKTQKLKNQRKKEKLDLKSFKNFNDPNDLIEIEIIKDDNNEFNINDPCNINKFNYLKESNISENNEFNNANELHENENISDSEELHENENIFDGEELYENDNFDVKEVKNSDDTNLYKNDEELNDQKNSIKLINLIKMLNYISNKKLRYLDEINVNEININDDDIESVKGIKINKKYSKICICSRSMIELNQIQEYLINEFSHETIKYDYVTLNGLDSDKLQKIKFIKYQKLNLIILCNTKVINEGVDLSFLNDIIVIILFINNRFMNHFIITTQAFNFI